LLVGPLKYNLPGTEYYQLRCWDGEIIPTPCAQYRTEVCRDIGGKDFQQAECLINDWWGCLIKNNSQECEADFSDCKWVYGYGGLADVAGAKGPATKEPTKTKPVNVESLWKTLQSELKKIAERGANAETYFWEMVQKKSPNSFLEATGDFENYLENRTADLYGVLGDVIEGTPAEAIWEKIENAIIEGNFTSLPSHWTERNYDEMAEEFYMDVWYMAQIKDWQRILKNRRKYEELKDGGRWT